MNIISYILNNLTRHTCGFNLKLDKMKKKETKEEPLSTLFSEFISKPPVSVALVALALLALILSMMEFYNAVNY